MPGPTKIDESAQGFVSFAMVILWILMGIGFLAVVLSFVFHATVSEVVWLVVFLSTIIYWLSSLGLIHPPMRRVYEVFGRVYGVLGPGIHLILKGIMTEKAQRSLATQNYSLFGWSKKQIEIDLSGGSVIEPKGAILSLKVKNTEKAILASIYEAEFTPDEEDSEWFKELAKKRPDVCFAIKLVSTLVRTFLNPLTIDQVFELKRGGYDLIGVMRREGGDTRKALNRELGKIRRFGIEVKSIVIPDFGLGENEKEARLEVLRAERDEVAASYRAMKMAIETGKAHGEMVKILIHDYDVEQEQAQKLAQTYITYFEGAKRGSLVDWRSTGDGVLMNLVAQVGKALKKTGEENKASDEQARK